MDRTFLDALGRVAVRTADQVADRLTLGLVRELVRPPIDQRLAKIEAARSNLAEALSALEELELQAASNSRSLSQLTRKLDEASAQKTLVQKDIDTLRELAKLDADSVRKGLGMPSRGQVWLERIAAFVLGIVGSVVASWLWYLTPWG